MKIRTKKAFTLIETLVAVIVLLLAVTAPLYIAARGIALNRYAANQVIAAYLAQDGMESVIAMKKDNTLKILYDCSVDAPPAGCNNTTDAMWLGQGNGFSVTYDLHEHCTGLNYCAVDMVTNTVNTCDPNTNGCFLYVDSATATYSHTSDGVNELSKFKRHAHIEVRNSEEAYVVMTVSWRDAEFLSERSFELKTNIYNTSL